MQTYRRRYSYIVAGVVLSLAGAVRARANGIIHDPAMGVERGDFSTAIFQGVNFSPSLNGGGVFGFYNASAQNITEMMFEVNIAQNLDPTLVAQSFACNGGNSNPYFFYCSVQYVPSTGLLGIAFWGTNLPPTPGTATPQDEVGLYDGIPPLLSGCFSTPDAVGCNDVGHFAITLNDNFALTGTNGGWNNTSSPGLFNGTVNFAASSISTVYGATPQDLNAPEPATFAIMGAVLIGLGFLVKRRRRKAGPPAISAAVDRIPGASTVHAGAPPA